MYLVRTPQFIQSLFPGFLWKGSNKKKQVFLTFDDGPVPEITPWVLAELEKYNAKASFFCVGDNILKFPQIFQQIKLAGHTIGNHTFNHLNGWLTDNLNYFSNVRKAAAVTKSKLFRPPYGKIKPSQAKYLSKYFRIVMWDVLSGDFDQDLSKESILENVIKNSEQGSIIVFHDNIKSFEKLQFVLPKVLKHFYDKGYEFSALQDRLKGSLKSSRQIEISI